MWVEYFYMIWNHFLCEKKRLSADAVVKNLTRESCKSAWVPDKENYNIQLTSSKQYLKRQWSKYSFQVLINEYFFDSAWGCSALASDNILTCPNKAMQLDPWVKASRDPWCRSNRAWTSQRPRSAGWKQPRWSSPRQTQTTGSRLPRAAPAAARTTTTITTRMRNPW